LRERLTPGRLVAHRGKSVLRVLYGQLNVHREAMANLRAAEDIVKLRMADVDAQLRASLQPHPR